MASFGLAWAAKTTEEVAAEPILTDRLDPESLEGLLALLRSADRAKFAGRVDQGDDFGPFVASFLASRPAEARPSSTISGK